MSFSLNEVEAMGRRAARGAGLAWGLAEETGKSVRWLSAHGLPGPELLAETLGRNDGRSYEDLAPDSFEGVWNSRAGWLCPLIAGASLCDRAAHIAGGNNVELGSTAYPLLLVPYVAAAAALTGTGLELAWAGAVVIAGPDKVQIDAGETALSTPLIGRVSCRKAENFVGTVPPSLTRAVVEAGPWDKLNAFAQRGLAPATEASRLAGAGAGLTDND